MFVVEKRRSHASDFDRLGENCMGYDARCFSIGTAKEQRIITEDIDAMSKARMWSGMLAGLTLLRDPVRLLLEG